MFQKRRSPPANARAVCTWPPLVEPAQRRAEIVVLFFEPDEPLFLTRPSEQLHICFLGQSEKVRCVRPLRGERVATVAEPLPAELPQRLEQPIAQRSVVAGLCDDQ